MKYRESGMPEQAYWESLFDIEGILDAFEIGPPTGVVAELGCGYGTFTLPVARRTGAAVHACDIDPQMVETTRRRAGEREAAGGAGLMATRVVIRAPNWLGDVVLSLAAVRDVRRNLPTARVTVLR